MPVVLPVDGFFLMCLWEKVSTTSYSSTILILLLKKMLLNKVSFVSEFPGCLPGIDGVMLCISGDRYTIFIDLISMYCNTDTFKLENSVILAYSELTITTVLFRTYFFVEVQLIYSTALVSGVQQSESVIHMCTYIDFFYNPFPF